MSNRRTLDLGRLRPVAVVAMVGLALLVVALVAAHDVGISAAPLLVVVVLAALVLRRVGGRGGAAPVPAAAPYVTGTGGAGDPFGTPLASVPEESRPRGPGALIACSTVLAALLASGLLLVLDAAGVDGITLAWVLGAAWGVVLAGLAVSLWLARPRRPWALGVLALLLTVPLGVTVWLGVPVHLTGGERTWTPLTSSTHSLGAGDAVLDLSGVTGPADVRASVGVGRLEVIIPSGLSVVVDATVTGGAVEVTGEPEDDGYRVRSQRVYGDPTDPVVHIEAKVGLGELVLSRD
jgi:hypothetical protein